MDNKELILLVDDDISNLKRAQKILGGEYRISATSSGKMALSVLSKVTPQLILLDVNMPEMDGFETFEAIKAFEGGSSIPVVFLTGDSDAETETKCFEAGATDFIAKPFVPQVLISRVKRILENKHYQDDLEEMVSSQVETITRIQNEVITGIANLIESRDGSTGLHVKNTQNYVRVLTKELRKRGMYPDILDQEYETNTIKASVLHDIGKIKIPDAILQKPGRLDDEEFVIMKTHAALGGEIIEKIISNVEDEKYVEIAGQIARSHHERWDGKGYPDGMAGEDIPLCARIMAVADVFDALYQERCYKPPIRPISKVFDILEENSGTQFDPNIMKVFLELKKEIEEISE